MESFHWDSSYITGLSSVDEQHHRLVDLINELGDNVAGGTLTTEVLDEVFSGLKDYATYHFTEEEGLMAEVGVDPRHIELHKTIHQRFLTDVTRMFGEIETPDSREVEHLLDYLVNWLAFHILGEDQNLAKQVTAIRSGVSPAEAYEQFETERDSSKEPLVRALHFLFDQVSARNRTLVELNDHLEELVAERTRELSEANKKLQQKALTDLMTGLPNRRHAMELMQALWQEGKPLACMMVDADHFKEINDGFGHDQGDVIIRHMGLCLQQAARAGDLVARLGGDEYLIICPDTDLATAMQVGEDLRQAINKLEVSVAGGKGSWSGSVSVGVAARSTALESYEALIAEADAGVYLAKDDGKNCVRSRQVAE